MSSCVFSLFFTSWNINGLQQLTESCAEPFPSSWVLTVVGPIMATWLTGDLFSSRRTNSTSLLIINGNQQLAAHVAITKSCSLVFLHFEFFVELVRVRVKAVKGVLIHKKKFPFLAVHAGTTDLLRVILMHDPETRWSGRRFLKPFQLQLVCTQGLKR